MKISIIIPVYNAEKFIEGCLVSIIYQTFQDYEIIIVNDGSTDQSEKEIQSVIENNPSIKFKYIFQENKGVTRARHNGVAVAEGEFVTFVDADDTLPHEALDTLQKHTMNNDTDIIVGTVNHGINKNLTPKEYIKRLLTDVNVMGPVAKLVRRHLLSDKVFNIPRHINKGEDFIMNVLVAQNTDKNIICLKDKVYNVNKDNLNSALHTFKPTIMHESEVYKNLFSNSQKPLIDYIKHQSIRPRINGLKTVVLSSRTSIKNDGAAFLADLRKDVQDYHYRLNLKERLVLKYPTSVIVPLILRIHSKLLRINRTLYNLMSSRVAAGDRSPAAPTDPDMRD